MSQNENDLQNHDLLSFLCSSCKSELRSIFSIGVPSYLNTSVSNISSIPHNSQVSEIVVKNNGKINAAYRSLEESEIIRIETRRDTPDSSEIQIGEPALPDYSSEKLKLIHDVHEVLFNNAETTVASKALVDSIHVVKREAVDADLAERRSNVYQLASRVLKLSEDIRKIRSNVLSSEYQEGTNETDETSPANEVSDIDSHVKSVAIRDPLMYTYNPFRMPGKEKLKRVHQKGAGTNKTNETSSTNEVDDTSHSRIASIAIQDPLMYTYNPFRMTGKQNIKRVHQKGAGTNKTNETSSTNEVDDTDSSVKSIAIQDPLMYTYNPFRMKRKQEIKRVRFRD